MKNPYEKLPSSAFWKPAVSVWNPLDIPDLWKAKFPITSDDLVSTAGSCFAQHLSKAMVKSGFRWLDSEPAPVALDSAAASNYNYGVFSFRTGNIYNVSLLRQWLDMAMGTQPQSDEVWENEGRFFDPLRPAIEPNGFSTARECRALNAYTLGCIKEALPQVDLFVFTLGLTEGWVNKKTGLVYAMCPGTLAGTFDDEQHAFHNYTYPEIMRDLDYVIDLLEKINPKIKILLTVSPVPLTATASGKNVIVSTSYSKSVLRAVAGDMATKRANVDYFPSYEIISAPPFRGMFFQPNMREVNHHGVAHVMRHFFLGLGDDVATKRTSVAEEDGKPKGSPASPASESAEDDIHCEEALLEAFSR